MAKFVLKGLLIVAPLIVILTLTRKLVGLELLDFQYILRILSQVNFQVDGVFAVLKEIVRVSNIEVNSLVQVFRGEYSFPDINSLLTSYSQSGTPGFFSALSYVTNFISQIPIVGDFVRFFQLFALSVSLPIQILWSVVATIVQAIGVVGLFIGFDPSVLPSPPPTPQFSVPFVF